MLQVWKFYKYEPPVTCILKHFAQVFNSKNLYVYRDLYKEIFARQSLICAWQKCFEDEVYDSVVIAPKKPRGFRGTNKHFAYLQHFFHNNRICPNCLFFSGFYW